MEYHGGMPERRASSFFREFRTSLFIATTSLVRGSRSTVVLIIFILSLSCVNMLFISGILFGLSSMMTQTLINVSSAHITIGPEQTPRVKTLIPSQGHMRAQIESIPGVIATVRHYFLAGSLAFDKEKNGQYKNVSGAIVGIVPSEEQHVLTLNNMVIEGSFLNDDDTDEVVISSALAGGYGVFAPSDLGGVRPGDKIRITYANGIMRTYKVKGIYNDAVGIFETFITAKEAESVLSSYDQASQILVKVDTHMASVDAFEAQIHSMFPTFKVQSYTELLGAFSSFLGALDLISFIVSVISVVVAAITIFVLIYVNAVNKRRQIGILKAIGIKPSVIVTAYVFQSLFYTACGIVVGLLLIFGALIPFLAHYPINIVVGDLGLVYTPMRLGLGLSSFAVAGLLAGLIPSHLVTREDILKAIWG